MFSASSHFDEYLDEQLSEEQKTAFEQQLLSDKELAAEFAAHQAMRRNLRRLYLKQRIASAVNVPPTPNDAQNAPIAETPVLATKPSLNATIGIRDWYALGFALLLLGAATYFILKQVPTPVSTPNAPPRLQKDSIVVPSKTTTPFIAKIAPNPSVQKAKKMPTPQSKEALIQQMLLDTPPDGYDLWKRSKARHPNNELVMRGGNGEETIQALLYQGYEYALLKNYDAALDCFEQLSKKKYSNPNSIQFYSALSYVMLYSNVRNPYIELMQQEEKKYPGYNAFYPKLQSILGN